MNYLQQEGDCRLGELLEAKALVDFQPFSNDIVVVEILGNIKISSTLDSYGGESSLKDHVRYFITKMVVNGATDAVKCRMLPLTFKQISMA